MGRAGPRGADPLFVLLKDGGGYEIRTREGVNPTRFPSLRCRVRHGSPSPVTWHLLCQRTPQDRSERQ
jgi:hypothetical protein